MQYCELLLLLVNTARAGQKPEAGPGSACTPRCTYSRNLQGFPQVTLNTGSEQIPTAQQYPPLSHIHATASRDPQVESK